LFFFVYPDERQTTKPKMKGKTMNPLTQLTKMRILPHLIPPALRLLLAAGLAAAVVSPLAQAEPVTRDVSPVFLFGTPQLVPGAWSALVRTDEGVAMTLHTNGLAPGSAATVWWVVFNNPELCTHGQFGARCGLGDLPPFGGDPSVQASLLNATGSVIGGAGIGNFGGYLSEGNLTGVVFGPGLLDARRADVHLVVRTHGDAIPGLIPEQLNTFNGGCPPNVCQNLQSSVHEGN
jgi:hypothetical protein